MFTLANKNLSPKTDMNQIDRELERHTISIIIIRSESATLSQQCIVGTGAGDDSKEQNGRMNYSNVIFTRARPR